MAGKLWNLFETICRKILMLGFHLIKQEPTPEQMEELMNMIKFGLVGVSNTLISTLTYMICVAFLDMDPLLALALGFFVSICNCFYWNNKYVFKSENRSGVEMVKSFFKMFISYAATGLVLNSVLLEFWIKILLIPDLIAPLINLAVTVPLNYILNKVWAFKKK